MDGALHTPQETPNLTLYTGSGSQNVYTYNGTTHVLEIFSSVWNNGTTSAGSFRIGWYLSTNTIISTTDYLIGTAVQPSLASGFFQNWNLSVDLDNTTVPGGTYYVGVYFDDLFQVLEIDENDNAWPYTNPFFFPGSPYPNLTLYTGSGSSNVYTYNGTTHVLEIFSSVWNNGTTAAGSFRIGWYLSPNTTISTTDYLIGIGVQPGLASGFYVNWNLSEDLDNTTVPGGTYYVGVYFDDLFQVLESNENDNAWPYTNNFFFPGPTSVEFRDNTIPETFSLEQNYPNPFNPTTTIRFALPSSGYVTLRVYNAVGGEVATLVNEELKPGSYEMTWEANGLSSGVYFYRLTAGTFAETKKLILIR